MQLSVTTKVIGETSWFRNERDMLNGLALAFEPGLDAVKAKRGDMQARL